MPLENFCALCGSLYYAGTTHACTNAPRSAPYPSPPQPATARPMQGLAGKLLNVARRVEGLKLECSLDPESPQAIRNGTYMSIALYVRSLASEVEAAQVQPASAAPAITDAEIMELAKAHTWFNGSHAVTNYIPFARAIEAAHSISGESSSAARSASVMEPVTTPDDLPGMWERGDFEGGPPPEIRGPDWKRPAAGVASGSNSGSRRK